MQLRRLLGVLTGCGLMVQMSCMSSARADDLLDDLSGRIEYAFYAADSRSLQQSVEALEKLQVEAGDRELQPVYLRYGRWKLAQLLAHDNPAQAQQAAETCAAAVTAPQGVLLAMHQALRAACLGMLEQLRPLRRGFYQTAHAASLAQARQAGSRLPEVQLVAAWLAIQKEGVQSAHAALAQAVQQYATAELEARPQAPHWGHAEACYWLGQSEMTRGDTLAARNMLERALVLAPDYRDARRVLQSLQVK